MARKPSSLSVTDLFCGAGGSSLGMHAAGADITLALNHWQLAVESHNANFPDTAHDCVDVSATDPRRYRSTNILWASPECTNHTIAKGQKRKDQMQLELFGKVISDPAEERSRATMFDVPRFAEYHDYEVVVVENVVDVRHWRLWDAWLHAMHLLGYDHKEVYFNSMFAHLDPAAVQTMHDFVPQSRDRLYVVFWKRGNHAPDLDLRPRGFCPSCTTDINAVQAWKNGRQWGRYRAQYVYRCPKCAGEIVPYHFAAWNAIDWSLPIERIGDRARPLKERTMDRIRKGLEKYGNTWLVVDVAYDGDRSRPMLAPLPTQTSRQTMGMVAPQLVSVNYYDDRTIPATEAMGTQTTANKYGLLMPQIVTLRNHGGAEPATDGPLPTFAAAGNHVGVLMPTPFLTSYYGHGGDQGAAEEPLATVTGTDRHALVMPMPFYLGYANSEAPAHATTEPLPTLPARNTAGIIFPSQPPDIEDCGFRMLQPHEVGRGMAFPVDYRVLGNKRDQVKQFGNAVTPPVAKMLMRRVLATFN